MQGLQPKLWKPKKWIGNPILVALQRCSEMWDNWLDSGGMKRPLPCHQLFPWQPPCKELANLIARSTDRVTAPSLLIRVFVPLVFMCTPALKLWCYIFKNKIIHFLENQLQTTLNIIFQCTVFRFFFVTRHNQLSHLSHVVDACSP